MSPARDLISHPTTRRALVQSGPYFLGALAGLGLGTSTDRSEQLADDRERLDTGIGKRLAKDGTGEGQYSFKLRHVKSDDGVEVQKIELTEEQRNKVSQFLEKLDQELQAAIKQNRTDFCLDAAVAGGGLFVILNLLRQPELRNAFRLKLDAEDYASLTELDPKKIKRRSFLTALGLALPGASLAVGFFSATHKANEQLSRPALESLDKSLKDLDKLDLSKPLLQTHDPKHILTLASGFFISSTVLTFVLNSKLIKNISALSEMEKIHAQFAEEGHTSASPMMASFPWLIDYIPEKYRQEGQKFSVLITGRQYPLCADSPTWQHGMTLELKKGGKWQVLNRANHGGKLDYDDPYAVDPNNYSPDGILGATNLFTIHAL